MKVCICDRHDDRSNWNVFPFSTPQLRNYRCVVQANVPLASTQERSPNMLSTKSKPTTLEPLDKRHQHPATTSTQATQVLAVVPKLSRCAARGMSRRLGAHRGTPPDTGADASFDPVGGRGAKTEVGCPRKRRRAFGCCGVYSIRCCLQERRRS